MNLRALVNGFFDFLFSRIFLFVVHKANVLKLGQVDATARRLRGGQQEEGVGVPNRTIEIGTRLTRLSFWET